LPFSPYAIASVQEPGHGEHESTEREHEGGREENYVSGSASDGESFADFSQGAEDAGHGRQLPRRVVALVRSMRGSRRTPAS
jgi:hypothetical protein